MVKLVYLNSKYVKFQNAKIHIEDRGLQFSDSVYEVIPFYNKKLIDLIFHIKRLKFSLKELNINYIINLNTFKKIFLKLINNHNSKNGLIYLQITRGIQHRDHSYIKNLKPNIIIYILNRKLNFSKNTLKGVNAITCEDLRWKRRDIKSTSLLANVLAKNKATSKKAYEAILIDKGKITEATASNVWIVKNNKLITHPANTDILKGVTRETIKQLILKNNLKFIEKYFTLKQMYEADEVFITSSGNFVTPIIKVDSIKINKSKIGKITYKLAKLYSDSFING